MIELVVARYNEAVEWTRNVPRSVRITIYDKGGDLDAAAFPRAELRRLPNVGREAHTYVHHILRRGSEVGPVTVFCQGRPFDHASDLHHVLRALASGESTVDAFRWLGHIIDTDDARGRRLFVDWSKNEDRRELAVDTFHAALFHESAPEAIRFYPGGQFAVTAARIMTRSPAFWERALCLSEAFPDGAHCFERLWDRIFGVEGVDPALLGGELCRYLKPIRRVPSGSLPTK